MPVRARPSCTSHRRAKTAPWRRLHWATLTRRRWRLRRLALAGLTARHTGIVLLVEIAHDLFKGAVLVGPHQLAEIILGTRLIDLTDAVQPLAELVEKLKPRPLQRILVLAVVLDLGTLGNLGQFLQNIARGVKHRVRRHRD